MKRIETVVYLLLSLMAFGSFVWWQQDDFYIHLQYAKHLLHHGEWSFNQGTPAYGTTSPLWVLLVAFVGLTGLKLDLVAKVLSVGFAVLTACLMAKHLSLFKYKIFGVLCMMAFIVNHWFRLAAGSGMEATLAAFLVLFLGLQVLEDPDPSAWRSTGRGVLVGLLVLTRPEWIVLPLFFLVSKRSRWSVILVFLLGFIVVMVPWFAFAWYSFGTIVPNTVMIKSVLVAPPVSSIHACVSSVVRLMVFYGVSNSVELLGVVMVMGIVVVQALGRIFRRPAEPLSSVGRLREIPLPVWGLLLVIPGIYFINQARGGENISYRYGVPALPMLVILGWLGIEAGHERLKSQLGRKCLIVGLAAILCLSNMLLSVLHFPFLRRSVQYMELVLSDYGKWLKIHTREDEVVACYDVGAIAYYSDRPVLDLIGLNSMDVIRFQVTHPQDEIKSPVIQAFKPKYLVTRMPIPPSVYAGVLPPYDTVLTRVVAAYRFDPSTLFKPPSSCDVNLLRLHWPELH